MPETNPEPGVTIAMESANASVQDLFTIQDELCDRTLQLLQLSLEERERRAIHFSAPWTVCP
jgi:hypothetical protein